MTGRLHTSVVALVLLLAPCAACGTRTDLGVPAPMRAGPPRRVPPGDRLPPPPLVDPVDASVPPPPALPPPAPPPTPPPPAADCDCRQTLNDGFPTDTNCFFGARYAAFELIPSCDIAVTRIELHTDFGDVAVLADALVGDAPGPGARIAQSALDEPLPGGWRAADFEPPVRLTRGQRIWITQVMSGMCSIVAGGTPIPFYGSFGSLEGPWEGPWTDGSTHPFTARLYGDCR